MLPRRTRRTPPRLPAPGAASTPTLCCPPSMCRSALIPVRCGVCPEGAMSGNPNAVAHGPALEYSQMPQPGWKHHGAMQGDAAVMLCQPCPLHRCLPRGPSLVQLCVGTGKGLAAAVPACPRSSHMAPSLPGAARQASDPAQPASITTGFKAPHGQHFGHACMLGWIFVHS